MIFIALFLAIILAVGWWIYRDTQGYQASLKKLVEAGFQIDYNLEGRPAVVFDDTHKRLAFVTAERTTVYDYPQVRHWEWGTVQTEGWANKSDPGHSYYIVFYLQPPGEPAIKVQDLDENEYGVWRSRLDELLGR